MTVKELIEKLSELDPNTIIVIFDRYHTVYDTCHLQTLNDDVIFLHLAY